MTEAIFDFDAVKQAAIGLKDTPPQNVVAEKAELLGRPSGLCSAWSWNAVDGVATARFTPSGPVDAPAINSVQSLKPTCEQAFQLGEPTSTYLSATGEPYVTIASGGIVEEGEVLPALCSSPELACRLWLKAFEDYAKDKRGKLYWRVEPVLDTVIAGSGIAADTRYVVYARLLISDRPAAVETIPVVRSRMEDRCVTSDS